MILLIVTAVITGIVWAVGTVYVPWLQQYQVGCNGGSRQPTFVSENAFALIFNYATSGGTKDMQKYTKNYDSSRSEVCGDLVQLLSPNPPPAYNSCLRSPKNTNQPTLL